MNKKKTVQRIILLPKVFHETKTKSPIDLVRESGYLQYYKRISINDIEHSLRDNSNQIEEWIEYAMNERGDPRYFIEIDKNNTKYILKYFIGGNISLIDSHSDAVKCCANYIKLYIEQIRKYINN